LNSYRGIEMDTVDCDLDISIVVECPNEECGTYHDLFEIESLVDDGWLYKQVLSRHGFGCDDLDVEITCKDCGTAFKVGRVAW
jgi:hypothetical protein